MQSGILPARLYFPVFQSLFSDGDNYFAFFGAGLMPGENFVDVAAATHTDILFIKTAIANAGRGR